MEQILWKFPNALKFWGKWGYMSKPGSFFSAHPRDSGNTTSVGSISLLRILARRWALTYVNLLPHIFQLLYHWILISFLLISEDIKLPQSTLNKPLWIHNFAVHREDSTHPSILQQPSHPPLLQQNPHIMTTMALLKSGYRERGVLYWSQERKSGGKQKICLKRQTSILPSRGREVPWNSYKVSSIILLWLYIWWRLRN